MNDIEPLEPALWFGAIRKLAQRWNRHEGDQLDLLLRHAYHLLQLTPRPLRHAIRSELNEASYEQWLENEAYEAAAEALVGAPATFAVFPLGIGLFKAEVWLPDQSEPSVAQAANPAGALLGAWIQCLLELEDRSVRPQSEKPHPSPRKGRTVRHLRSIAH